MAGNQEFCFSHSKIQNSLDRECGERQKAKGGLPWWLSDKDSPPNAGDTGLISDQEDPTCLRRTKPVQHNH